MLVPQSKLARLTPNLGILWIWVCSFWLCGSIVANPIIYRLVPSPSRHEIRQLSTIFLGEKCGNFPEIYNIKSVYILQTFCAYLCRFYLDYVWSPRLFFIVILQRKWQDFANISFNKMCTFYRHYLNFSVTFCVAYLSRFY